MPWAADSKRRSELPTNWPTIRRDVLRRDGHRCTAQMDTGLRCPETLRLEVDHLRDPLDHSTPNLTTLCRFHHAAKTARQGMATRALARRKAQHPGISSSSGTPGPTSPAGT